MAYIGPEPAESFTSFATQEFSTSATASYTLDHAVANENEIALFVNNVRQQPGSGKAYTASSTTLTLSAATASTDTMYCVFLGRALQTVTPATNSITAAMVGNDLISGKDALASEPADTDEFLVSDAGTLKRIDYSLIKGGGITEADMWRITADTSTATNATVSANWERADSDGYGKIGTGLSESSGIFSFASTGIYLISFGFRLQTESDNATNVSLDTTTNNSSYGEASVVTVGEESGNDVLISGANFFIFDVTDTSTHKFLFRTHSMPSNGKLKGDTGAQSSGFTCIRLGDT